MNQYLIEVERDSVCMGDDIDAPHEYKFSMPESSTLTALFEHLAKKRYLASVAGENHSWEATVNNKVVAIFLGNSKIPESSKLLAKQISKYAKNGIVNVSFKYKSATT
jgi:hypothetical protein